MQSSRPSVSSLCHPAVSPESHFPHPLTSRRESGLMRTSRMTAIMVACLASFRALFSKSTRPAHQRIHDENKTSTGFSSRLALLFSSGRFTKSSKGSKDSYAMDTPPPPVPARTRNVVSVSKDPWSAYNDTTLGSEERILPPNSVHVKHEVDLV